MDHNTQSRIGFSIWTYARYPALITLLLTTVWTGFAAYSELFDPSFTKQPWVNDVVAPIQGLGIFSVTAALLGLLMWKHSDERWAAEYYKEKKSH